MAGQDDMVMMQLQVEIDHVGQRIFLGIDRAVRHGARKIRDVDEGREKATAAEGGLMLGVVQGAQPQADAIRRRADRADRVADVADAVVPPADDAIGRLAATWSAMRRVGEAKTGPRATTWNGASNTLSAGTRSAR